MSRRRVESEEVCGGDGPAAGLAVDVDIVERATAEAVNHGVGEAESVRCCHLYFLDYLETEAEVPCYVESLVLESFVDACAACQEGERGAGGHERRDYLTDGREAYHVLEVDGDLDVITVRYDAIACSVLFDCGVEVAAHIHHRCVEAEVDYGGDELEHDTPGESASVVGVEY